MAPLNKAILPVFFLAAFLGAIVLGPLLYLAVGLFAPVPFHRIMDRALLISALAALGLFWRRIPWAKLWPLRRNAWMQVGMGYFIALMSAQAMIGFYVVCSGIASAHLSGGQVAARVITSVVAALIVPPLEETVFRGFLILELIRYLERNGACAVAALIFMLAHFLKIPESLDHQPVHLWSGAKAVGLAFLPLLQGAFLNGRGLNLFLIGLILGGIFLHHGSLWVNAGLHSGWILALLLFSGLTRPADSPNVPYLGGGDLVSSPVTSLVLMALAGWLWRLYHPPSDEPGNGESARSS